MKKFALFLIAFSIFLLNVNALVVDPDSGSMTVNQTADIGLYATHSTDNVTVVMLKLGFTNITVLGFATESGFIAGPTCSGGVTYTSSSVCADVAKLSGTIADNELIGTVSISWGSTPGSATIERLTGNGVYNGVNPIYDTGVAGTYTLLDSGTITPTPTGVSITPTGVSITPTGLSPTPSGVLPGTAFDVDLRSDAFIAASGIGFLLLGIYLLRVSTNGYATEDEETE